MKSAAALQRQLELLGWVITAVVIIAILLPIYWSAPDYLFYLPNLLFIVVLITATRYIFLLPHTWLATRQSAKVVVFFLCIPLLFVLIDQLNNFQTFLDEEGAAAITGELRRQGAGNIIGYIRSEMLFFGTGAIIATVTLMGRMILSIWRYRNLKTV